MKICQEKPCTMLVFRVELVINISCPQIASVRIMCQPLSPVQTLGHFTTTTIKCLLITDQTNKMCRERVDCRVLHTSVEAFKYLGNMNWNHKTPCE